jgi:hypothetical protein
VPTPVGGNCSNGQCDNQDAVNQKQRIEGIVADEMHCAVEFVDYIENQHHNGNDQAKMGENPFHYAENPRTLSCAHVVLHLHHISLAITRQYR